MSDWFDQNGAGTPLDVVKLLDSTAGEGVHALVAAGALVSLGLTSDGGALGLTVTVDGRWRREYFRDSEAMALWIAEALPAVAAARGRDVPAAGNGRGSRRSRTRS
jgi:hypothetical protein